MFEWLSNIPSKYFKHHWNRSMHIHDQITAQCDEKVNANEALENWNKGEKEKEKRRERSGEKEKQGWEGEGKEGEKEQKNFLAETL